MPSNGGLEAIKEHLDSCELCSKLYNNLVEWKRQLQITEKEKMPARAAALADKLFATAMRGILIRLSSISAKSGTPPDLLAADGDRPSDLPLQDVSTFISESPEIVLRVIRAGGGEPDKIQLITEDRALSSNVLVQAPELDCEFLTDLEGCAELSAPGVNTYDAVKWQIKLPDAVFSLEPLDYDPDKTESVLETVLESDQHDRIKVRMEQKAEGKLLQIEILELNGSEDFGDVNVVITHGGELAKNTGTPNQAITFTLPDKNAGIGIRLFQK